MKIKDVPAGREPVIALESIGALLDRELVRGDRIFGRIVRCAAVADDKLP
jgi:hypothetical protein